MIPDFNFKIIVSIIYRAQRLKLKSTFSNCTECTKRPSLDICFKTNQNYFDRNKLINIR